MANKSKTRKAGTSRSTHRSRVATRSSVSNRYGIQPSKKHLREIETLAKSSTKPGTSKEKLLKNLSEIQSHITHILRYLNN